MFSQYIQYIKGDCFHSGLKVKLSSNSLLFRDKYLLDLVSKKKILHIGFVDHLPLIDEKIKNNYWLHKKLIDACETCIGIDINKDGIKYLKEKYNMDNIYALDIMNDNIPDKIRDENFDYLLLPDVIEHIGNPVLFLTALKNKFKNVHKFIITTPNAFCYENIKFAFRNIEFINTDHRFWFTPYTITKVLNDSGYQVNNIVFAEHSRRLSIKKIIKNLIIHRKSFLRDTLIIEAK